MSDSQHTESVVPTAGVSTESKEMPGSKSDAPPSVEQAVAFLSIQRELAEGLNTAIFVRSAGEFAGRLV